ncbi:Acyl carrier protein/NADH-ubiquinone oxidoreductase, NDUFAB1/SDAP subunit [Handroanthus impetiginosus]|uniref:Acyl carrier protein n=1 Tax=Handroanthus impetiginosus TaxID=429701 RepID=A0A2G9HN09_9LAMI|nr:Acyl carrier protein/NADH-ubiquinone oxidoreductase, NDUFAB1/SDAP subunit [Handroanthus impetiginosus]
MASVASTIAAPPPTATILRPSTPGSKPSTAAFLTMPTAVVLKLEPKISQIPVLETRRCFKKPRLVSCAVAQPETLHVVQSTIAKQLSIEEGSVTPQTKFVDLGADSLDTVEIMMALEEKFGVSIGESGAENIATVQDAADLIEKVKTAAA